MESLSLGQLYKNLLDKEQRSPGCPEESGEGEAGVIRTEPFSHLPALKSFYVHPGQCQAHSVENNYLYHLLIIKIMTFPTDLTHKYE